MFGFLGIAGALAAGFSGKLANSKRVSLWKILALSIMASAFLVLGIGWSTLLVLVIVTFVLDVGSRMNMSLNQGCIYRLNPKNHSRLNALYMMGYYFGGSLGPWIGTSAFHLLGAAGVAVASCMVLGLAYLYYLIAHKAARVAPKHFQGEYD